MAHPITNEHHHLQNVSGLIINYRCDFEKKTEIISPNYSTFVASA